MKTEPIVGVEANTLAVQNAAASETILLGDGWTAHIYREWEFPDDVTSWWQAASDRQLDVGLFTSPGWLQQWWSGWGEPGSLFAVILRQDDNIRGIFPCYLENSELGDDVIRSLGVEVYHDVLADIDAIPWFVCLVEKHFPQHYVQLDYLSERSAANVERAFKQRGFPTWTYADRFAPYAELTGNWNDYFSSLPPELTSQIQRKRRRAERDGAVQMEIHRDTQGLQELLTEAFEIEARSWKGRMGTAINQIPKQERFIRLACHWAAEQGKLWLAVLRLNGKMVAFDIDFENAGTLFLLKTSIDEEAGARYSPGHLLRHDLFRSGFETGAFHRFNGLGMCDPWKMLWMSHVGLCKWLTVYPRTMSGRWRYLTTHAGKEALKRVPLARWSVQRLRRAD